MVVSFLAWIFSVIVTIMGPNIIWVVVLFLSALPISAIAYFIGKGQPQLKDD